MSEQEEKDVACLQMHIRILMDDVELDEILDFGRNVLGVSITEEQGIIIKQMVNKCVEEVTKTPLPRHEVIQKAHECVDKVRELLI